MFLHVAQGLGFAIECGFFMLVAKWISDQAADDHFDANQEIEKNANLAVGLRRAGLYLGVAIGMYGSVSSGISHGFWNDAQALARDGVLIVIFTMISRIVNDKVIIPGIDNNTAIKDKNVAVGLTEAGGYIATGLVMYGAASGEGGPWWSTIVWFALGQVALLMMIRIYEWKTPYEVVNEIQEGNVSAGLMLGGMMVAMGFILKGAIAGPSSGWIPDLEAFGISTINSVVLLVFLINNLVDRFFLPGTEIQTEIGDQNIAAISVVISVKIAMAIFISAVVL